MGSYYDDQSDPYRRQGQPPRQTPRAPSPTYTYYRGPSPPPNAGPYAPGPPPSHAGTYPPAPPQAPTIVSVPRDIIYVQQPAPTYRNPLASVFFSHPTRNQRLRDQILSKQEETYDNGDDFIPPRALASRPVQASHSAAVAQNVFQEGQTHYETLGVSENEAQEIIVQIGTLILERMQARINDPASTEELRNVARGTFINVAKAFGVLVNPISRQAYDQSIGLAPLQTEYYLPEYPDQYPPGQGTVHASGLPDGHGHNQGGGQNRLPTPPPPVASTPVPREVKKAWMPEKNPYESLCISPGASPAEIEKAFASFEESFLKAQDTLDEVQLNLARAKLAQRKKAYKFLMDPLKRKRYGKYLMYGSDASDEEDDEIRGEDLQDRRADQVPQRRDRDRLHVEQGRRDALESANSAAIRERLQNVGELDRRNALPPPPPPGSVISDASSTATRSNPQPLNAEQYERWLRLNAPRQTGAPPSRQVLQASHRSDNGRPTRSDAGLPSSPNGTLAPWDPRPADRIAQQPKDTRSGRRERPMAAPEVEHPQSTRDMNTSDAPLSPRQARVPFSRSSIPRYKPKQPERELSTRLSSEDEDDRSADDERVDSPARRSVRNSARPKTSDI